MCKRCCFLESVENACVDALTVDHNYVSPRGGLPRPPSDTHKVIELWQGPGMRQALEPWRSNLHRCGVDRHVRPYVSHSILWAA
jgi:hypothetical protein